MEAQTKETNREEMERKYMAYRRDIVPEQLERARRRYFGLVREARRLKLNFAMTNREMFGDEYD